MSITHSRTSSSGIEYRVYSSQMADSPVSLNNRNDDPNDDGVENTDDGREAPEGPACLGCRKRKRKCSRTQPCFHCTKFNLDCEYDEFKAKPKLKAGVLQSHSERLDNLEKMFLGQCLILRHMFTPVMDSMSALAGAAVPEFVAKLGNDSAASTGAELLSLVGGNTTVPDDTVRPRRKRDRSSSSDAQSDESAWETAVKNASGARELKTKERGPTSNEGSRQLAISGVAYPGTDQLANDVSDLANMLSTFHEMQSYLPPDDLMTSLIDIYFQTSHPWIPVLHRRRFEERLRQPDGKKCLAVILHAIVVATTRFSSDPRLRDRSVRESLVQACRQYVILKSVESYSVENLQASIIIAFDSIGAGKGPKSWTIVDSMTRTVEHLRLSFEDDDGDSIEFESSNPSNRALTQDQKFITRMTFLREPESWIESEERRRVFWNVFLLDRFCSISTGWNPSLTAVDVQRRLPSNGELWAENRPARARYFGFQESGSTPSAIIDYESEEVKALGGFSYCVEASEYLSTVTRFFLEHDVTPKSNIQLQELMVGFKDLDLRLAKWKFNLPARWREVKVKPKPKLQEPKKDPLMDQNLTLAHITHNTSVILLHQFVAYPIAPWQLNPMKSSQRSSAETCIAAAKQICDMTQRYLSVMDGIVNPQFSFCLFVCGRMLLSHSSFTKTPLLPEFEFIVHSLGHMARRWHGIHLSANDEIDNLASKFQRGLINTRTQMDTNEDQRVDIRQPVYSIDSVRDNVASAQPSASRPKSNMSLPKSDPTTQTIYPELSMFTSPPLPITFQADHSMRSSSLTHDLLQLPQLNPGTSSPGNVNTGAAALENGDVNTTDGGSTLDQCLDDLSAWFDDPQFLELDRVWTFGNLD